MEKKKPYEPPAFRKVVLEVKTSVLGVCQLSTAISPTGLFATCKIDIYNCFGP